MKKILLLSMLLSAVLLYGQKTESPYLKVLTKNAMIPLLKTDVNVQIAGSIANVHISQVYQNTGKAPIEAIYVFPLSTQAAVHKMDMSIGDRTIHAKIYEKQEANKVYTKAVKEGKRASKLDQERPNVFQMNVGNIMPKDEIKIDIYYTEILVPSAGEYQFAFPGVVGPRFTGENTSSETTFNLPTTKKGIADSFDFDIKVCIEAGMVLQKITSHTHKININYPNTNSAEIFLSKSNVNPSNRDFILKYALRGNNINTGLLLFKGEKENFFAYMMEPPVKLTTNQITPREYVFIVDISGSMTGFPLDVSKKLLQNLLGNLRETDAFNILLFAGGSNFFKANSVRANSKNINEAMHFLSGSYGSGSTNLLKALNHAYGLPRFNNSSSRSMVIITDGYVSIEKEAFQLIKNNLNQANVFTFGIGSSVNRYLIEGMAKVSNSKSFIVTNETAAYEMAKKFKTYIAAPLLTQIKFETDGFETYDVEPTSVSDVFMDRPVLVFGKWKGNPTGKITVTGKQGSGNFRQEYQVSNGSLSVNNDALKYLWARKKIESLDDYSTSTASTKKQVIELGLQYNLLTAYTSFVAVDNETVNENGESKKIVQPLPMPDKVSNAAVGAVATIKGQSIAKKTYKMTLSSDTKISKATERAIKIWFKYSYSKLTEKFLNNNTILKINFNSYGEIEQIEVFVNGKWIKNELITTEFLTVSTKSNPIKNPLIITLKPSKSK